MTTLSTRALNRALLARQMLLERERTTATAAVERLVGMQAQLARPPFVGLWTRLHDFRRAELGEALRTRKVVRVTSFRGTLHLMTARDYLALRGALQPMLTGGMQAILRERASALDMAALDAEVSVSGDRWCCVRSDGGSHRSASPHPGTNFCLRRASPRNGPRARRTDGAHRIL